MPLGIGGADDDKNLWPEPRRGVEPVWNAERKDELEWVLRDELCRKLGDGVNQAADLISATASIPSLNFIPLTTFGNWF